MEYTTSVFASLKERYPEWKDMATYLRSFEGGKLRIIDYDYRWCMIRYTELSNHEALLPHLKWFRSVVWDKIENLPVCVAPSQSSDSDIRSSKFSTLGAVHFQNFIEGTMINAFKTGLHRRDTWTLSTKSIIGAKCHFSADKTFEQLWEEGVQNTETEFHQQMLSKESSSVTKIHESISHPCTNNGEFSTFASFILQHPENRIVEKIQKSRIYLVLTGTVLSDGTVRFIENNVSWSPMNQWMSIPYLYPPSSCLDGTLQEWMNQTLYHTYGREFWRGLTIKNTEGNRWKIDTYTNRYIRSLRGNEVTHLHRFCRLFKEGNIYNYITAFPEDQNAMMECYPQYRLLSTVLYNLYVDVFIHHVRSLSEIHNERIQLLLMNIHRDVYISTLRPLFQRVYQPDISTYVSKHLSPEDLCYAIEHMVDMK